MNQHEIPWLAGLFEGEGTFRAYVQTGRKMVNLQAVIGMSDADVVRRAMEVAEMGHFYGPYATAQEHHKPMFKWQVSKSTDAYALGVASFPRLGERRREQVRSAARLWLESVSAPRPTEVERFWRLVDQGEGCWLWAGHVDRSGFGTWVPDQQHRAQAHRYAWELINGDVPPRMVNECGRKDCVRPDHWRRDGNVYLTAEDEV